MTVTEGLLTTEQFKAMAGVIKPAEFLAMTPRERRHYVLDYVVANPERHDQRDWGRAVAGSVVTEMIEHGLTEAGECGTTACYAGWAALFGGGRPSQDCECCSPGESWRWVKWNGEDFPIQDAAAEILGLTVAQAGAMFSATNTRDDLAAMVARLDVDPKAGLDDLLDRDDD